VPRPVVIGAAVILAAGVITLVVVLARRGGDRGSGFSGTMAVVSEPVPPLPAPPRPAPAARPKKSIPEVTRVASKPTLWEARPDPPVGPPAALANYAADAKLETVFAALDGPFFVEGPPMSAQSVIDLRTGQKAGEFHANAPTWKLGRLAPDGQTVVGPDSSPKGEATKKDGQLFVWKQREDKPAVRLAVGAGAVLWADFVAPDRFAAAVFEETVGGKERKATLRIWDVASGSAVHTVALEPDDLAARHAINPNQPAAVECSEYEAARGIIGEMNTRLFYTPAETIGTVSPGGRYVVLGGKGGVTVVSAAEGRVAGRLPLRGPLGRLDYLGFGFSSDGATLYALIRTNHNPRSKAPFFDKRTTLITWSMADGAPGSEVVVDYTGGYGMLRPGPLPGTLVVPKFRGAGPPLPSVMSWVRTAEPDRGGAVIETLCGSTVWTFPGVVHRFAGGTTAVVRGYWAHAPENLRPKGPNVGSHGVYTLTADAAFFQAKAGPALAAAAPRPASAPADRSAVRVVVPEATAWAVPMPPAFQPGPLGPDARLPRWPDAWSDADVALINFTRHSGESRARFEVLWARHDPATGRAVGAPVSLWPWTETDPGVEPQADDVRAALSADGELLALRDPADAKRLDVWDAAGRRLTGFVPNTGADIDWLGFAGPGTLLTLSGGRLTGWQWRSAKAIFEVEGGYEGPCHFPPGRAWLAAPAAAHVDVLDTKDGRLLGRCADEGIAAWHHTSLSPDGKLLLRTTVGDQPVPGNPPRSAFVLWDLPTGKMLSAVNTAVSPATRVYWCAPRRFLTIHGYTRLEGKDWRKYSHELIDADALAVIASYGPPAGYAPPRVGHNETDGLAGDPAGRVWVNVGGAWRPTAFPTLGADAVLAGQGPELFPFRPGTTVRAEVDLGERGRSRNAAESLAARLQRAGFTIGPGAWALRLRASRTETSQKLSLGLGDKNGLAVPGAKFTWDLLAPSGESAWSGTTEATWNYGGSKYRSGRKVEAVGPGFQDRIMVTNFDFGGRDAVAAIWDEIIETAADELGPPPAMPRALLEANGQRSALPVRAEFQVPAK
jgi:hypothetical protein